MYARNVFLVKIYIKAYAIRNVHENPIKKIKFVSNVKQVMIFQFLIAKVVLKNNACNVKMIYKYVPPVNKITH